MPKHLINTLGTLIVVGIIAVAAIVVAIPLYFESQRVDTQAQAAAVANDAQQAQVDALAQEQENLPAIEQELDELEDQIPGSPRIDTVSQVVAKAAGEVGVSIVSMTPGDPVDFGATRVGSGGVGAEGVPAQAQQVQVTVNISGKDISSVLRFIDALRQGPRLLGNIGSSIQTGVDGAYATVTAVAFILPTGGN